MPGKEWPLAFGERGNPSPDDAAETIKEAQADKKKKELKREDELAGVKHTAEVAKAEAQAAEAKRQAEEAKGGGAKSPIQFKPVEIDIHKGEEEAEKRAQEAREEAKLEREKKEGAESALADERQKRLEDKFTALTDELKEIREGRGSGRTADVVIEEAVKTAEKLGYAKTGTPTVPPEVQVQLKQLDINLQVQLEQMRDDRDRRDKDWQLTLKKWEDEKELKRAELAQKAEAEEKRMAFLTGAEDRIGRIIARTLKGGGGISGAPSKEAGKSFHIEAAEGEEGEIDCPACSNSIFVAPDASEVICDSCGQTVEIRRTVKPATKGKAKSGTD